MDLEYTSIEDIFLLLGLIDDKLVVVNELVDNIEVVEGVVLKMVLVVFVVDLHQLTKLVVKFEQNRVQPCLVHFRKRLLQYLVRNLQDRL